MGSIWYSFGLVIADVGCFGDIVRSSSRALAASKDAMLVKKVGGYDQAVPRTDLIIYMGSICT